MRQRPCWLAHPHPSGPVPQKPDPVKARLMKPLLLILAMSFLALAAPVAEAQQSMSKGTGKMELQSARKKHSYSRVSFSDGTKAEKFEVRAGDCSRSNGDCKTDRERSEFSAKRTGIRPGDEMWYAWSIFLPRDFPKLPKRAPSYTFGQIHQRDSSGPELLFELFHDGFFAVLTNPYKLDDDPMNPIGSFKEIRLTSQKALTGRWTRIKVNAKWSRGEDGFITVWMNNKKVWSYRGATTNSNGELYFKYGLYRAFVSRCGGPCPTASIYYTNVRQGRSEAEVN